MLFRATKRMPGTQSLTGAGRFGAIKRRLKTTIQSPTFVRPQNKMGMNPGVLKRQAEGLTVLPPLQAPTLPGQGVPYAR